MIFLIDCLKLVLLSIQEYGVVSKLGFWLLITLSLLFSFSLYHSSRLFARAWNKGFKPTASGRVFHILAASSGLIFCPVFLSISALDKVSAAMLREWETSIKGNTLFDSKTFTQVRNEVKRIRPESITPDGGVLWVDHVPESPLIKKTIQRILFTEITSDFTTRNPALAWILKNDFSPSQSKLIEDIDRHFSTQSSSYKSSAAVAVVTSEFYKALAARIPVCATRMRILVTSILVLLQGACFLEIGLSAYNKLKVSI
jgi:hypothetical protein